MEKIKNIIFDLFGTLVRSNWNIQPFKEKYFAGEKLLHESYFQRIDDVLGNTVHTTRREQFNALVTCLGLEDSDQAFGDFLAAVDNCNSIEYFDDAEYVLKKIGKTHNIALISNCDYFGRKHAKDVMGLHMHFQKTYFSCDVGFSKPDKRIYQKALNELNWKADETAFVGDIIAIDIAPPKELGMRTVLLDRNSKYQNPEEPHYVISSLHELIDLTRGK